MNQDEHKIVVAPDGWAIAVASVLIAVYVRVADILQLVNSDSFKAQATNTTDYDLTVTAARGDIDSADARSRQHHQLQCGISKLLMGRRP